MGQTVRGLKPYRVDWRPDLVTQWLLIGGRDTHEGAIALDEQTREKYSGQTRIVSQHVINVTGLGGVL